MKDSIPVGELLRLACLYAEQDREAFIEAHKHMPDDPACIEAKQFLKRLRAYRRLRWGRAELDALGECRAVPVDDLFAPLRRPPASRGRRPRVQIPVD